MCLAGSPCSRNVQQAKVNGRSHDVRQHLDQVASHVVAADGTICGADFGGTATVGDD